MPQDELWAASPRTTGFTFRYELTPDPNKDHDLLSFSPHWGKTPSSRNGEIVIPISSLVRYAIPDVFNAAYGTWWKCKPKDVPAVVRSMCRQIPLDFEDGSRP